MRILYRLKQLGLAVNAKISEEDISFIKNYLNEEELQLFLLAPDYEKRHAINVAKDILDNLPENKFNKVKVSKHMEYEEFVKAALLHDIGKIPGDISIMDKGMLVIFDKITNGRLKKVNSSKVYYHYNHGKSGAKMLINTGTNYSNDFIKIIENHHNDKCDNKYVNIFKIYDDRN